MWAALDGLSTRRFDVLISDLSMPGRSGFDLIREVRQALPPPASRVPAVAVTALTRPEDRQRPLGAGCYRFPPKPVDPDCFVRLDGVGRASSERPYPPATESAH